MTTPLSQPAAPQALPDSDLKFALIVGAIFSVFTPKAQGVSVAATVHAEHCGATCSDQQAQAAFSFGEPISSGQPSVWDLFSTWGFLPRWQCGTWSNQLGWLHIGSDLAIFLAYAAIPAVLAVFLFKQRSVPLRPILWLFVAFILSCGLTHLTDATMFYVPAYRFLGLMKLVTAGVSLATVVAMVRVLPAALTLPGIVQGHRELTAELPLRRQSEARLEQARIDLEARSAELTTRERRLASAMAGGHVAAVRWNIETNQILWEIRAHALIFPDRGSAGRLTEWSAVLDDSQIARLSAETLRAASTRTPLLIELATHQRDASAPSVNIRLTASLEPPESGQPQTMIGMFRVL